MTETQDDRFWLYEAAGPNEKSLIAPSEGGGPFTSLGAAREAAKKLGRPIDIHVAVRIPPGYWTPRRMERYIARFKGNFARGHYVETVK